jgi:predicted nucleic acid-binding protein
MIVFVDTSALFALMVRNDYMHIRAKANFEYFSANDVCLLTSSYVLLETIALLQSRIGLEAVSDFQSKISLLMEIVWVDSDWHERALQRLFAQNDATLSLVDCLSFEIMESKDLHVAYAFDRNFESQGFTIAAFHDLDRKD